MKKKIIFIHPKNEANEAVYPLAGLYLGSVLEKAGFDVLVFDNNEREDYGQFLDSNLEGAVCVGISAITGSQVKYGTEIADHIKKNWPKIPVVWGGRHGTAVPDVTIKYPSVDFLVRGEGEESFLELAKALSGGSGFEDIRGLSYKHNGKVIHNDDTSPVDLSGIPHILPWKFIDIAAKVASGKRSIGIQTGRGCPFSCTYCSHEKVAIEKYRCFSPEFILDNLEPLIREHGITHVNFYEPHFISIPSRVEEICRGIIDRGLKIEWTASARANTFIKFSPELLLLMKKSGCRRIGFGFESGSRKILERIDKKIEPWQIIRAVELCGEYGIVPEACFMTGFPFETFLDCFKTLAMIGKIKKVCPKIIVHIQGYVPFPGTILYNECMERYGLEEIEDLKVWGDYSRIKDNTPWIGRMRKTLIRLLSGSVYLSYYGYIKKRKDMRARAFLHGAAVVFYSIIYLFSFAFKKEFTKQDG